MKTRVSIAKSENFIYIGRRVGHRKLSEEMGEEFIECDFEENIHELQAQMIVRCAWALMKDFQAKDKNGQYRSSVFFRCCATERMLDNYLNQLIGIIINPESSN